MWMCTVVRCVWLLLLGVCDCVLLAGGCGLLGMGVFLINSILLNCYVD